MLPVGIGIVGCLLFIFYQDLKYRAVYWFMFPVLAGLLFVLTLNSIATGAILSNASFNLGFLLVQFLLLSVYFSLKNKKVTNLTKEHLGWGDILFLAAVSVYFSPLNFFFFYFLSLLSVLLFSLVLIFAKGAKNYKIPFAGLQALLMALLLTYNWVFNGFSLQNDDLLIFYIYS